MPETWFDPLKGERLAPAWRAAAGLLSDRQWHRREDVVTVMLDHSDLAAKTCANVLRSAADEGWLEKSGARPACRRPLPRNASRSRDPRRATEPSVTASASWLAERVETSRRAARHRPCPTCGADTLVGPDHDTCSLTARVDLEPVDHLAEVIALLTGRRGSYDLVRGNLHHREPEHVHAATHPHPIHLTHHCSARETR